jgi:polar amino acid transport system permease protein
MPVLRVLVTGYIEIMRGTPVLVQLVWVFYAFPVLTAIQLTGPEAVILALSLNTAAFYGEAFRSGIQAVPHAQTESADVLGLSYFQRMRYVVVPQAARIVLPVLISTSISLFKDTSLVSTIGVQDMMYQGLIVSEATYRPLEILTTIAVMYFVVAFPVTIIMRRIEIHVNRHLAR